ncbi:hypothetical protein [Flavobacterium sp. K5-23]|uniref:hypothetical protein n=1 Tax=Flavobacterium sp. K5-23 TaxID=2746225 RepID=UPI00200DCCBF|nr:hypothetical protein [Flavobacterium sp. K5-23]UQD56562.1 hypothetical protein FLAK523_09250 [Flavobacterium sp. K5-23]
MKFAVQLVLFLFITFLLTPTIVRLVEENTDTSYFYSMSEEERTYKEITADYNFDIDVEFMNFLPLTSSLIQSKNILEHDSISSDIVIPPPEQV